MSRLCSIGSDGLDTQAMKGLVKTRQRKSATKSSYFIGTHWGWLDISSSTLNINMNIKNKAERTSAVIAVIMVKITDIREHSGHDCGHLQTFMTTMRTSAVITVIITDISGHHGHNCGHHDHNCIHLRSSRS